MSDRGYPMVVRELSEEEGGGFVAFAPDLRGCMADGETEEAAIADLHAAIEEWIDAAKEMNRDIPKPGSCAALHEEERKEIRHLLKAQENLIQQQDQALKDARSEIERMHARLSNLLERDVRVGASYFWATDVPAHVADGVVRRHKRERLPN